MFDVEPFLGRTAESAYPARPNESGERTNTIDWLVMDILGFHTDDDGQYVRVLRKTLDDPNMVVVQWRNAGIEVEEVDAAQPGVLIEVTVSATSVRALNAYQWALMEELAVTHEIRLAATVEDTEDDPQGKTNRTTNRARRSWVLLIDGPIMGMNELFIGEGS